MRVLSSELPAHVGKRVTLAGWVHANRELGAVSFVMVRDRCGIAQVVSRGSLALTPETVVEVEGDAVAAAQAPGGVELHDPSFNVLAEPVEPPPIEMRRPVPKEKLPRMLDFAPVALRHPQRRARFEVAAASLHGFRAGA